MTKKILIAGGSGLIGKKLTRFLLDRGYSVAHLGRVRRNGDVPAFIWNPDQGTYDTEALRDVEVVINLAGAGVADKRWTAQRKQVILESRTNSVRLLASMVKGSSVHTVIGASAIGYYGFSDRNNFVESDPAGRDFLAQVVKEWEESYAPIDQQGKRLVNFRIGIVLAKEGGALAEIARPIRFFAGAPLGTGRQMMSWIHIDDLCAMFAQAIEHTDLRGIYNAVSPHPVSNREMTYAIAKAIGRPIILPPIPAFILRTILGEMASVVVNGSIISAKKILDTGFKFSYEKLEPALTEIFKR